tara:strand:+ start:1981 stop:2625 length:645 start_codon:yes stop_codon:yes gene_type:complete
MAETLNLILIGFLGLFFFALIGFIMWLDYKKSKDGKKQVDPVQKGLFLTFLLWGAMFMAEAVGFFESGWNRDHFYIHLILAFVVVGIFLIVASRKKPLSFKKQVSIVKNIVSDVYTATPYVGLANMDWLNVYKITKEGSIEEGTGQAGNFLLEFDSKSTLMKIWVKINVYTGQLLHLQKSPPILLENKLLGSDSPYKDDYAEQFEDKNEKENAD